MWLNADDRLRPGALRAVFAISLAFYVSWAISGLFPVAGPYYAFPRPAGVAAAVAPARFERYRIQNRRPRPQEGGAR